MKKFFVALLSSVVLFLGVNSSSAQVAVPQVTTANQVEDVSPLSLGLGVNVSNSYFFRGVGAAQDTVVLNPTVNLGYNVFNDPNGFVTSFGLQGSTWAVFSKDGNESGSTEYWYEASVGGGANVTLSNLVNVAVNYNVYSSPNDSFETVQEVATTATFFDKSFWNGNKLTSNLANFSGFNPYVTYAYELEGTRGVNEGQYVEVGVTPGVSVSDNVTVNFPARVGLGLDGYYGDSGLQFGYVGFGPQVVVPIATDVYFTGGVEALYRDEALQTLDGGSEWEFVGKVGVAFKL